MALAVRQTTVSARSTATSLARVYASAVLSGSLLIAHGAWFGSGSTASAAFSDNINGAWGTPTATGYSREVTGGDGWIELCAFANSGAGTITVTMNPPGTGTDNDLTLLEVTGAATASPRDVTVTAAGNLTSMPVTTGTLAQANEILVASGTHQDATTTLTQDTADGFTLVNENENNSTGQCFLVQYKIVSSTASTTVDVVVGGGGVTWISGVASYKEAAGVAGSIVPEMMHHHG